MKISHTPSWIGFLSVVGYSRSTDLLCGPSTSDLTTRLLLRHQINRPEFPESKRQNFRNPHAWPIPRTFRGKVLPFTLPRRRDPTTDSRADDSSVDCLVATMTSSRRSEPNEFSGSASTSCASAFLVGSEDRAVPVTLSRA